MSVNKMNIKVSVCVITYNHELYIRQCLDSLVSQKTSFGFEIVIRDDLSKDATPKIIEEYKKKYPELIRVLPSYENVGGARNSVLVFSAAQGDYISWCEGDDFFTSVDKLELQFNLMEAHKSANICIHPSLLVNGSDQRRGFYKGEEVKFLICQDLLNFSGQFAPSSSYFFRKEVLEILPSWFCSAPIGDLFLELYSINNSCCIYTPQTLSAYRTFSLGSWRDEIRKGVFDKKIIQYYEIRKYINLAKKDISLDVDFDYKLSEINYSIAVLLLRSGFYNELMLEIERCLSFRNLNIKKRYFLRFVKIFPRFARVIYYFKAFLQKLIECYRHNIKLRVG